MRFSVRDRKYDRLPFAIVILNILLWLKQQHFTVFIAMYITITPVVRKGTTLRRQIEEREPGGNFFVVIAKNVKKESRFMRLFYFESHIGWKGYCIFERTIKKICHESLPFF